MSDIINGLGEALAEKSFRLQVVRLYAAALISGYDHEHIQTFTFSKRFLNMDQVSENHRTIQDGKNPPYSDALYHNAVRLKSGDLAEIPLTRRPEPPAHMKVSTEEK